MLYRPVLILHPPPPIAPPMYVTQFLAPPLIVEQLSVTQLVYPPPTTELLPVALFLDPPPIAPVLQATLQRPPLIAAATPPLPFIILQYPPLITDQR